jgi:autotransporter-associated beta strand protein
MKSSPACCFFRSGLARLVALALGLALGGPALWAQTPTTWIGTDGTFASAANWTNGVPANNSPAKAAVFDGQGVSTLTTSVGGLPLMTFSAGSYTITITNSKFQPAGITIAAGTQTFNGNGGFSVAGIPGPTFNVAAGAALNISNNIALSAALTLDGGGNFDFSGNLGSTGTFTKNGAGTAILRGPANTFSGNMVVSAGTLLINGTFSSTTGTTTVNGGTLGGTGTMNKATTINSGGTLAPGAAGVGTLTFGGALTLATGSTTAFELNGTTRGTGYDGINLTSTTSLLTYGGLLSLNFGAPFLNGADLNLFDLPTTGVGAVPAGSFDMITGAGNYAGSFTNTGGIWTMESGGQLLTFTESTGNLTFSAASAVPEPATYAVLVGAVALTLAAWRRKRTNGEAKA